MLAYILALAVAFGSLAIYLAAFFFPEIHRKSDFVWSGVGLFYALVLWVCAGRITGGVLLGQTASVALLGWFAWQTLTLRYSMTPAAQRTNLPSETQVREKLADSSSPTELGLQVGGLFAAAKSRIQETLGGFGGSKTKSESGSGQKPITPKAIKDAIADVGVPEAETPTASDIGTPEAKPMVTIVDLKEETPTSDTESPDLVRPAPPPVELVEAAVEDAEAKHLPSDPPEVADTEITDSAKTSEANQPLDNPPNPT